MAKEKPRSLIIKTIFSLLLFIISILCIIWLFKVKKNSKQEPIDRDEYIDEDYLDFYTKGDFCYNHFNTYIEYGAFEAFDIRMKKIKNFSKAILISYFMSLVILLLIFGLSLCLTSERGCLAKIMLLLFLLYIINLIVNLILFIIASVHYFKSKWNDFDEFSNCRYLNRRFNNDYHFVYVVDNNYKKFFILNIVSIILNILQNIINRLLKRK
jgi:hypothetical protein